jgi:hypothetical protein
MSRAQEKNAHSVRTHGSCHSLTHNVSIARVRYASDGTSLARLLVDFGFMFACGLGKCRALPDGIQAHQRLLGLCWGIRKRTYLTPPVVDLSSLGVTMYIG